LSKRLQAWDESHCSKVLGIDRANLLFAGKRVNFYDATSESAYAEVKQRQVVDNESELTLAGSRALGDWAVTIKGSSKIAVALYANFYSANAGQQQNTLLHELLHAIGWDHDALVGSFASQGLQGIFDISDWLERDCQKAKR